MNRFILRLISTLPLFTAQYSDSHRSKCHVEKVSAEGLIWSLWMDDIMLEHRNHLDMSYILITVTGETFKLKQLQGTCALIWKRVKERSIFLCTNSCEIPLLADGLVRLCRS